MLGGACFASCASFFSFSWFELEWAEAQIRAGKPGLAMKKAMAVHTHFEDFVEDQFDFHTYCMRKVMEGTWQQPQRYSSAPPIFWVVGK